MAAHARLGPSGYDRWGSCPASVELCAALPDSSSEFAAEGTMAHEVRAMCLDFGLEPHDFVGHPFIVDGFKFVWTDEMAEHLQPGIDRVRNLPGRMVVEYRVDLGRWLPGQFGTLDCGVVGERMIYIDDLKFGAGVPVSAVNNAQLRIYALGFWENVARHESDATDFLISIDQPRTVGGSSEWKVTLDELLAFGEEVRAAGEATYLPDAPFVPGEKQCQWCAGARQNKCAAHAAFMLDLVGAKFDDLDGPIDTPPVLPDALTPERRSYVVQHASMISAWLDRQHDATLADAIAGRPTPNLKAVQGRKGDRRWTDADAVEKLLLPTLGDETFTKKLISPAQVEKLVKPGKKRIGHPDLWSDAQKLYTQDDGKPCLVPLTDERPALQTIDQKFEELAEEDPLI